MKSFYCFSLILLSFYAGAQEIVQIHGKVLDKENKHAVAYAHIAVVGTNSGTASSENGEFQLLIPSLEHQIRISCIGYDPVIVDLAQPDHDNPIVIYLKINFLTLDEVKVTTSRLDPTELIAKAVTSRAANIYPDDFFAEYYSTATISDSSTNYSYKLETIFRDYQESKKHSYVYLEQRQIGEYWDKRSKCGLPAHFEIHEINNVDQGAYQSGIFHIENLPQFDLKYNGLIPYEGDTVFVIEYNAPNPTRQLTGYGGAPYYGKIYIEVESNAIVRHSGNIDFEGKKGISYDVLYKKVKDYYFPYYIESSRELNVKKKFDPVHPVLTNIIILRNVEFEDITSIPSSEECNRAPYNKAFWDINYPVK